MSLKSVLLVSAFAATAVASAQTVQGVVVYQVGDGSAALTSASTAVSLVDYSTSGALLGTFAIPTTVTGLTASGTATSEGALTLSGDGANVVFTGYHASTGVASIASTSTTTGAAIKRGVGTLNLSTGSVSTSTTTANLFSGNNIRAAYSPNSTGYLAVGATNGAVQGTLGTTTATAGTIPSGGVSNFRYVGQFGGSTYASTASGSNLGILRIDPATGAQTPALTIAGSSIYSFQFLTATMVVVADDRAATSGGGIKLYDLSTGASTPTLVSSIATSSRSFAIGGGKIYYTSIVTGTGTPAGGAGNALLSTSFNGMSFDTTSTLTLATAATNTAFRGVAFAPVVQSVPEPSALAALGLGAVAMLRRRRKA